MASKECCSGCSASQNKDYRDRFTKLKVFNWLENLPVSNLFPKIVEVQFKNTRKGYFLNEKGLPLFKDDVVAVEGTPGHDTGIISLTGDLVFEKMRREGIDYKTEEFKKVYRKARPGDIDKWYEAMDREKPTIIQARKIIERMGLDMKLSDVEYQGDNTKAIFYYIADKRVDFRQLIKVLAEEFSIRIEMRQIGARQEAGLVGGIGPCGRELCCSSWLTNFSSVSTGSARKQELSLNPQKLAGQCSKLKCCLNYEIDIYEEARAAMPNTDVKLQTAEGEMRYVKTDVLRQLMWYAYTDPKKLGLFEVSMDRVFEIQKLNSKGKVVESLQTTEETKVPDKEVVYGDLIGQEGLNRFDKKKTNKRHKKNQNSQQRKRNDNNNKQNNNS